MTHGRKVIKYWLPVFLGMGLVFLFSTGTFSAANTSWLLGQILSFLIPVISPKELAWINYTIRKLVHVLEYFILGLLLFRAFRGGSSEPFKWRWALFTLMGVLLLAAGDEVHQFFIPARAASPVDVGIDTVGGVLAPFFGAFWYFGRVKGNPPNQRFLPD